MCAGVVVLSCICDVWEVKRLRVFSCRSYGCGLLRITVPFSCSHLSGLSPQINIDFLSETG